MANDVDEVLAIGVIIFLVAMLPWISGYMTTWDPYAKIKTEAEEEGLEVGVFSDPAGQDPVTQITWGQMQPGSQKSVSFFLRNEGPPIRVCMVIRNWQPAGLMDYAAVTWDQENSSMARDQMLACQISLQIFQNVTGITNFSFDIVISLRSQDGPGFS